MNTAADLEGVLSELIAREPIFHRPEWGTTRADFENMTAPDFCEIGASGRRYDRAYVLNVLEERYAAARSGVLQDQWQATNFHCRVLANDVYLLTYTLLQNKERRTRRTTIWAHRPEGWKILFHQGTLVQD